ncbi:hypothetical protein, partial [Leifsonia sp. SIMBA_070]
RKWSALFGCQRVYFYFAKHIQSNFIHQKGNQYINTIIKGQPQTLFAMKRINAGPDISSKDLVRVMER